MFQRSVIANLGCGCSDYRSGWMPGSLFFLDWYLRESMSIA